MEAHEKSLIDNQIISLREGIKAKYRQYHLTNQDRYPEFDYNTNRANYEPLRDSFDEEFYNVRGYDRETSTISIPSINTLALLFTNDSYMPGKKILNTCRSYAEGPTQFVASPEVPVSVLPQQSAQAKFVNRRLAGRLMGVLILGVLLYIGLRVFAPVASGLVIIRPAHWSIVPQELIIEGKVTDAEIVWMVVHPTISPTYYVQPPSKVQDNGSWIGVIYVGGPNHGPDSLIYQIQAVVNPTKELHSGEVLSSWPEAELSSQIVEVIRGPKRN
ncbi:hypothetical protein ACFSUS_06235 [Spirosoma soli]|uniref:Uncharacterized protein n=1 Tax=Spirosoma soli TaxID=1770529 RepID=A0ABW5LZJ8_9BACT